jgi:hypothetical protein
MSEVLSSKLGQRGQHDAVFRLSVKKQMAYA